MGGFLGIDPGVSGGIAVVSGDHAQAWKMPDTDRDLLDLLREVSYTHKVEVCYLEFVRSSPQMGVASAFKFGWGYGGIRMAAVACCIRLEEVTPQKWQRVMGCLSKGDKNVTKRRAQELFPGMKITHSIADALLIAEYGRRLYEPASRKAASMGLCEGDWKAR